MKKCILVRKRDIDDSNSHYINIYANVLGQSSILRIIEKQLFCLNIGGAGDVIGHIMMEVKACIHCLNPLVALR